MEHIRKVFFAEQNFTLGMRCVTRNFFRFTSFQSLDFSFFYLFENVCKIQLFRKDIKKYAFLYFIYKYIS